MALHLQSSPSIRPKVSFEPIPGSRKIFRSSTFLASWDSWNFSARSRKSHPHDFLRICTLGTTGKTGGLTVFAKAALIGYRLKPFGLAVAHEPHRPPREHEGASRKPCMFS